jgi:autoinducer 2-degrading protein
MCDSSAIWNQSTINWIGRIINDLQLDFRRKDDVLGIFASITVKPERRKQFLSTIQDTARRSVQEETGCVRFDIFQDKGQENRYLLYEVYVDEAAFEVHLATPHARRAVKGSKTWAEGPFDVIRAESIYPDSELAFETIGEED